MSNKNISIGNMALHTGTEVAKTGFRTLNTATTVTKHGLAGVSEASKALETSGKTVASASKIVSNAAAIGDATTGVIKQVLKRQENKVAAKTAQMKARSEADIKALQEKNVKKQLSDAASTKIKANQSKIIKNAVSKQRKLNLQIEKIRSNSEKELLEITKMDAIQISQLRAELDIRELEEQAKNKNRVSNAQIKNNQQTIIREKREKNARMLQNINKTKLNNNSINKLKKAYLINIKKESDKTKILLKSISNDLCGKSTTGYHIFCTKKNIYENEYKQMLSRYKLFYENLDNHINIISNINYSVNKINNTIKTKINIIRTLNYNINNNIIRLKTSTFRKSNNNHISQTIHSISELIDIYEEMLDNIHNNNKYNIMHTNNKKQFNTTNKLNEALEQSNKLSNSLINNTSKMN